MVRCWCGVVDKVIILAWNVGVGKLSLGVAVDTVAKMVGVVGGGSLVFGAKETATAGWSQIKGIPGQATVIEACEFDP